MWLFLAGSKGYQERLGYVVTTCPDCRVRDLFTVEQEKKKFTIYMVPTFQYSKKQYMVCPNCREVFEVAEEIKAELLQKLITQEQLSEVIKKGRLDKLLQKGTRAARRKNSAV